MFDHRDEIFRAMREFEKLKDNPAYQSAMEHQRRMAKDPSYRAIIDYTNRQRNDPAHQAIQDFLKNQRQYREVTDALVTNLVNDNIHRELADLRNNLAHSNAELWLKSDLLNSDFNLRQFERFLGNKNVLIPILPQPETESESEEKTKPLPRSALQMMDEFYENLSIAEQELADDEQLVIFIKLGKKEYRIKGLAIEEKTNKIAAILDDEDNNAFLYCSPFRVEYRFYKENLIGKTS